MWYIPDFCQTLKKGRPHQVTVNYSEWHYSELSVFLENLKKYEEKT